MSAGTAARRQARVASVVLALGLTGASWLAPPTVTAAVVSPAVPAIPRAALAVAAVPLAAELPFASDDSDPNGDDERETGGDDRAAGATPSTARLDRLAAVLRREPLAVDPEVDWIFDAAEHRALERELRAARVPVLVAAMPMLDEDESGGDTQRILRTLQERVGRKALYVVVDQDGRMDLASVGLPLNLSIPYSLMTPKRDERPYEEQSRDPGPRPWESVPSRLRGVLAAVAQAQPGPPNGVVDDVDPLEELNHDYAEDRLRSDTIFLTIVGAILGLGASATILVILRALRRRGAAAAARSERSDGPRRRGGRRRRGRRNGGRGA